MSQHRHGKIAGARRQHNEFRMPLVPAARLARLQAHVAELLMTIRRLELANAGLRRRLDDLEDGDND